MDSYSNGVQGLKGSSRSQVELVGGRQCNLLRCWRSPGIYNRPTGSSGRRRFLEVGINWLRLWAAGGGWLRLWEVGGGWGRLA